MKSTTDGRRDGNPRDLSHNELWFQIADLLDIDDARLNRSDNPEHASTGALHLASESLYCDYGYMRWLVKEWVLGGGTLDSSIEEYINKCQWSSLAEELYYDSREIRFLMTPRQANPYKSMMRILRNKYFEDTEADDPLAWLPSKEAIELTREKNKADREGEGKEKKAEKAGKEVGSTGCDDGDHKGDNDGKGDDCGSDKGDDCGEWDDDDDL